MRERKISRRDILKATTVLTIGSVFPEPLNAATPAPSAVTPTLIEAARKEGKVSFYTAMDLLVAERLGKAFEAEYSGVTVRVERAGSERIFQRVGQEQQSRINAVDVVCSLDPAHFLSWTRTGWLASYVPEDVAKHFQSEYVGEEPGGCPLIPGRNDRVVELDSHFLLPLGSVNDDRARDRGKLSRRRPMTFGVTGVRFF